MRIPLIAANWKMHKTIEEAQRFIEKLRPALKGVREVDIAIAPPFTALIAVAQASSGLPIHLAAQNVHPEAKGAFTGEISPVMLRDIGCHYVIVGHSERRTLFAETDALVNLKVKAAFKHDLIPILCVGESLEQQQEGKTETVLETQLRADLQGVPPAGASKLVVAYEPIWAIGTGQTATAQDAQAGCSFIRQVVALLFNENVAQALRVQYGGSVKPDNARDLLSQPDVDGALVGGASLDPNDFAQIVRAAIPH